MEAQQTRMDVISNNLANINTTGFKRSRAAFQDLLYETIKSPGAASSAGGSVVPAGVQIGHGTRTSEVQRQCEQGSFMTTNAPLDLSIEGSGYFQIQLATGDLAYTRDGAFHTNADGNLVTADGYLVDPGITVPPDAQQIHIASDGIVTISKDNQSAAEQIGQLQIARFANPSGMRAIGHNLFQPTDASGEPAMGNPGTDGRGTLSQGALEMSNVNLVEEMVNMITTERAYEFGSKILKSADSMLQTAARVQG
jgi:flagellar basal-body rod protein FlgG